MGSIPPASAGRESPVFHSPRRPPYASTRTTSVRRGAHPAVRMTTTGNHRRANPGRLLGRELRTLVGLSALGFLLGGEIAPDDVVQLNTSTRAVLGGIGLAGACLRIGALAQVVGQVAPERTLALLARPVDIPGKRSKVSVLSLYPSYLGELVETGLRLGHRPEDFGLRRISVGGRSSRRACSGGRGRSSAKSRSTTATPRPRRCPSAAAGASTATSISSRCTACSR